MLGLIADANVQKHLDRLIDILRQPYWFELWADLDCRVVTFADLALPHAIPDDVLWRVCQQRQLVLVTANRNRDGADSLQAAIEASLQSDSLPVLTLSNARRVLKDREYAGRVAERLLNTLLDIDILRGSGRLYLP